nr:MAG TPA: hypothetical protein [Caudoviricetes sp.]
MVSQVNASAGNSSFMAANAFSAAIFLSLF